MPDPLPKLLRADEWQLGTAVTLARRSRQLTNVDTALVAYERRPSPETLARLKLAFKGWVDEKGGIDKAELGKRNRNDVVSVLNEQLNGGRASGTLPPRLDLNRADLINARRGVVYLFSHIGINDRTCSVLLQGAVDLTSSSLSYVSAEREIADKAAGINPKQDSILSQLGSGSTGVSIGGKVTGVAAPKVENAVEKKKVATTGLAYKGLDLNPQKVPYTFFETSTPEPPSGSKLRDLWNWLVTHLVNLSNKVIEVIRDKVREVWADKSNAAMEYLPKIARLIINKILATWLTSVAPIIGGVLEVGKGIMDTAVAAVAKYKEWAAGKGVQLLAGHPSTIVQAIRNAMWLSVGEGLYGTLKGSVNLGMNFAAPGANALWSLIISVVETVAKTCWRIVEIKRLGTFFAEAQDLWKGIDRTDSLHLRPMAFNKWFSSYATTIPAIAVVALVSGICGDKMRYLQMYQSDDRVIEQSAFDRGVSYLDQLKVWGYDYLDDAGFSFQTDDPLIKHMLELGGNNKKLESLSAGQKCLKIAAGFLA